MKICKKCEGGGKKDAPKGRIAWWGVALDEADKLSVTAIFFTKH